VSRGCSSCGFAAVCLYGMLTRPAMPAEGALLRCVGCGCYWRISTNNDVYLPALGRFDPAWADLNYASSWIGHIEDACPMCYAGTNLRCRVACAAVGCFRAELELPTLPRRTHRELYHFIHVYRRSSIWRR